MYIHTSAYFEDGYYCDHVILEYWDGVRWVVVDSEMDVSHIQRHNIPSDVLDVPDDQFIRGGQGWLMCRNEGANPDRFGLGSQSPVRGLGIVLGETLLDLAALNREEMLCWDSWGYAGHMDRLTDADKAFLDDVAAATLDGSRAEE